MIGNQFTKSMRFSNLFLQFFRQPDYPYIKLYKILLYNLLSRNYENLFCKSPSSNLYHVLIYLFYLSDLLQRVCVTSTYCSLTKVCSIAIVELFSFPPKN